MAARTIWDLIPQHQHAELRQFLDAEQAPITPSPAVVDDDDYEYELAIKRLRALDPESTAIVERQLDLAYEFIHALMKSRRR